MIKFVTQDITKDLTSNEVGVVVSSICSDHQRLLLNPPLREVNPNLRENIIVSDQHRPFCTPTKHILVTQNPKTETFPKSTYASRDAEIPSESQKEITKSGFNPD